MVTYCRLQACKSHSFYSQKFCYRDFRVMVLYFTQMCGVIKFNGVCAINFHMKILRHFAQDDVEKLANYSIHKVCVNSC